MVCAGKYAAPDGAGDLFDFKFYKDAAPMALEKLNA